MGKVYAIGEMLIDFTPYGEDGVFKRNAGGAPANVAVCVARLGGESAVVTKLGKDLFGDYLVGVLQREKVDAKFVYRTDCANTALAFVTLSEGGERSFSFYRNPSADLFLNEDEVSQIPFRKDDILHFGSVDLVDYPVRKAHKRAIARAKAAGAIVSFDPNLRYNLWKDPRDLLDTVNAFIPYADVVKVSEEELADITGLSDEKQAVKTLFRGDVRLIFVTRGGNGASVYTKSGREFTALSERANCVDTTGAGDTFVGAVLFQLQKSGISRDGLDGTEDFDRWLHFANKAAWFVVQRAGAIPAMPFAGEVFQEQESGCGKL